MICFYTQRYDSTSPLDAKRRFQSEAGKELSTSQHRHDTLQGCNESINVVAGVIEGEGGTHGALHLESVHEGLSAVVTGTYGDAQAVEECA